ncbi:hypothetical protein B0H13DRAFT_2657960 [Mycena leptocephala]|nr:hypothetical protein B0H13DRAFT_2657960 [Mycena leptocephala]
MHASSSSPAHVLLPHRARVVASPDQSDSSYVVRDVRVLLAYDEPPVRAVSAPLRISPVRCSSAIKDSAPLSVFSLEPSPLRHAIAIHLIRIRATSLTDSITVTATCALSLDPSRTGCRRTRRRGRCLPEVLCSMPPSAWATLSSSVCPTVSNAAGSSQPLAPSMDKTSDALLAAAYKIPRRSDSAFVLEPSLRPAPALGVRVDVLLVTRACAGSKWRGQCDGDAVRG